MNDKYNGWTNWATWNANLWLTNDEQTYENARDYVQNHRGGSLHKMLLALLHDATTEIRKTVGEHGEMEFELINWDEIVTGLKES